jgi:hypothetical protein
MTRSWFRARTWLESCNAASAFVFCSVLYLLLTCFTAAIFFGDSVDYASSIVSRFRGTYDEFWEFGHVLWRPMGWLVTRAICFVSPNCLANDSDYHVLLVLSVLSWSFGLLTVYLFHRLAWFWTRRFWCASLSTVGFVTAQAFLNFTQAGTPYVAGLAMLMLGIYILEVNYDPVGSDRRNTLGGIALAGAVLLWFPYVLVVPAAVLIPLVTRRSLRGALISGFSFAAVTGGVYLAVILGLRLHTLPEILAWMRSASHGVQIGGWIRAGFGFARSFINMGNDGVLFKRYLLHDPFNPVSVTDLMRTVLAKMLMFYALLAAVVVTLVATKQKAALVLLALAAVPVLLFAVHWQGGDLERYLPLYPFLFIAIAVALSEQMSRTRKLICAGFLVAMALINVGALSRYSYGLREASLSRRAGTIPISRLTKSSVLFVTHNGDELISFARSFPWASLNRHNLLHVRAVLEPNGSDVPKWKSKFGEFALAAWAKDGNVWVSQRLLSVLPRAEWNWAEHDDRRIGWRDLPPFFRSLQYQECIGENDGFCLLAPSFSNRELLSSVRNSPTQTPELVSAK